MNERKRGINIRGCGRLRIFKERFLTPGNVAKIRLEVFSSWGEEDTLNLKRKNYLITSFNVRSVNSKLKVVIVKVKLENRVKIIS